MYIVLLSLIIYFVSYFTNLNCQSFQESENPYQPPKYIFQIVWPILLFLYGLSWNKNRKNKGYLYLLIILSMWMVLYLCLQLKDISFLLLIFSVYKSYQLILETKDNSLYFLFLWLIFASFLNFNSLKK